MLQDLIDDYNRRIDTSQGILDTQTNNGSINDNSFSYG